MSRVEHLSDLHSQDITLYLALAVEPEGFYCEYYDEYWLCYDRWCRFHHKTREILEIQILSCNIILKFHRDMAIYRIFYYRSS